MAASARCGCWSKNWGWPKRSIGDCILLKVHLPYHESDHVLNLAFNALCDGDCLEDLELRRNDEVYLDALGARRVPDPTTAGDFCRRFTPSDVRALQEAFHETRHKAWARQPAEFFAQARIDMDGVFAPTGGQARPTNVKQGIVREREFKNLRLVGEEVAEFDYRPTACKKVYRLVVVRKWIDEHQGQRTLFSSYRYFFYLTNDRELTPAEVVFEANDRCDQENLNAQLKGAVRALHAPVDNLVSNWAYMVMVSLAWNLKAWWALLLPEPPGREQELRREEKKTVLKMEFKTFRNAFIRMPCQIVRGGRRLIYRLLGWNRWQVVLFRWLDGLRC